MNNLGSYTNSIVSITYTHFLMSVRDLHPVRCAICLAASVSTAGAEGAVVAGRDRNVPCPIDVVRLPDGAFLHAADVGNDSIKGTGSGRAGHPRCVRGNVRDRGASR